MPSAYYLPSGKLDKYIVAYFLMEGMVIPECGFELTIYPNGHVIMGLLMAKHYPLLLKREILFRFQALA